MATDCPRCGEKNQREYIGWDGESWLIRCFPCGVLFRHTPPRRDLRSRFRLIRSRLKLHRGEMRLRARALRGSQAAIAECIGRLGRAPRGCTLRPN